MKNTYGSQQSDAWLRNRIGRITGSRLVDVCSYLTRASGTKKAGEPSAKRDNYRDELISERGTGRAKDHYVSLAMEHGTNTEDEARMYYEGALRVMCAPVSFVLHSQYDFTGSSPDSLVGSEGVLEIKCPESTTHVVYRRGDRVPEEYLPQVSWELACTGRKWVDFVSYDPRWADERLRFFYRRLGRDELELEVGGRTLTGEAVIDYYTNEVIKLNAEVVYYFTEGGFKTIAPYPVEIITEDGEIVSDEPDGDPADFAGDGYAFLDKGIGMTP
jgi:hypothetical protein